MSVLDTLIGVFCHQLPERSPHFMGQTFPVCFRCAGLYLGMISTYLCLCVSGGLRRCLPSNVNAILCSVWLLPLLIDGWGNWLGWWVTSGPVRAVTGLAAGVVLPLFLLPLARPIAASSPSECKPSIAHVWALAFPLACGGSAIWLLLNPGFPWIFRGLALLSGASLAAFCGTFAMAARALGRELGKVEI